MTIQEKLDELAGSATSKSDKGARLEKLMQAFLQTDPTFRDQFSDVWLWGEWPGNGGKHDTGIDLVAADQLTGGTVAIQCKFFAPSSTVSKPDIDSFLSASGKHPFTERIIVSTTDKWNANAEDAIKNQQVPVRRIGVSDLEASPVNWVDFSFAQPEVLISLPQNKLRPHQEEAIAAVRSGFDTSDRGKLIMACGTGKTFTSLKLAERTVGAGGTVLFLVPSISLLSQTLREWTAQTMLPLNALAVCSDAKVTARSKNTDEDISAVDLPLPATTSVEKIVTRLQAAASDPKAMTVVFSTYQSIQVVADAQKQGGFGPFDLIICDEAHRTTGVTLAGTEESAFVRVHDNTFIQGAKRLYMTATPRIYDDTSKAKAGEANAILASMDHEDFYGPEFHRLGFGEAVDRKLLTDYKVLVLAVDEKSVARTFQLQLEQDGELHLDDAAKIVGCWNGLAKRGTAESEFAVDPLPMKRAVAFCGTIKDSKLIQRMFSELVDTYVDTHNLDNPDDPALSCQVRHVDGSYNALERNTQLDWLRAEVPDGECRILTNARCLSEGVDVPSLDAVMFLSPRKSQVDVVQSVGRVMRRPPKGTTKNYGYIILPIGVPAGMSPEQALNDNKRYAAVWEVLRALRAHDERFDAMINKIDLTGNTGGKLIIGQSEPTGDGDGSIQPALELRWNIDELRDAIFAKVVAKVGSKTYWEDWAKDVATIAQTHITRIEALLESPDAGVRPAFDQFIAGLRGNLNDGITETDAIEMLSQHLITRPVFDALFGGYDFAQHNPVAQSMEQMLAVLDTHALDDENQTLEKFYGSVRMKVAGLDTTEGRQKIIVRLYDTFFATAFKKTVDKLGIVYTPVEIVDFILRSADWALREHFGQGLTDEGVHILDGFVGTGTFIVRLIQSGLISAHDLARKYTNELHANEILLLAYYIAAVNIETAYQDAKAELGQPVAYVPFPGLVLTDTFQSYEDGDAQDLLVMEENNHRLERQKNLPITVIVGNPPWSVGQESANDDNQNESYPSLDAAIQATYVARGKGEGRSLYDSYVRAIKWATLRIGDRGVVAYVTNGGWLDSNTAAGMRLALMEEVSELYVFNLRGRALEAGEVRKKEAGNVFGGGTRTTVAIIVGVKKPGQRGTTVVNYLDIGDYLSQEQKLAKISEVGAIGPNRTRDLVPNPHGDWITQRGEVFMDYLPIESSKTAQGVFKTHTLGLGSNRDTWVYNFGRALLAAAMKRATTTYAQALDGQMSREAQDIKWTQSLETLLQRGVIVTYQVNADRIAAYRPFTKQFFYADPVWTHRPGDGFNLYPTPQVENYGLLITGVSSHAPFSILATDHITDKHLLDSGQYFGRWRYESDDTLTGMLDFDEEVASRTGYRRVDNITDSALAIFQRAYGAGLTKDDIFHYVYAMLHSPEYRQQFAPDLKKMLPRIPLVSDPAPLVAAGEHLLQLHLGYESITPFPLEGLAATPPAGVSPEDFYRVEKMRFPRKGVRDELVYNSHITLRGIPEDAYRYQLGARSAIEWVMDRYRVTTDSKSGITNDPNDWSREVGDPRYILDLVARIVTVSVETMKIVDALPELDILEDQAQ